MTTYNRHIEHYGPGGLLNVEDIPFDLTGEAEQAYLSPDRVKAAYQTLRQWSADAQTFHDSWPTSTTGLLTADESGRTTATLTNTGLVLPVLAGRTYRFRYWVLWRTTLATVGLRLGITTPAFATYGANVAHIVAVDGAAASFDGALTTSGDAVTGTGAQAINTDYLSEVSGIIVPSADGSLTLQAAAETTGATVTVRSGSMAEAVEVSSVDKDANQRETIRRLGIFLDRFADILLLDGKT